MKHEAKTELWDKRDNSGPKMISKGPPFSKVRDTKKEWAMVQKYAKSIGGEALYMFGSENKFPSNRKFLTSVVTFRALYRNGVRSGRSGSSVHTWSIMEGVK